ncbi:hypothetical protein [Rhodococcus qingshengii]|uniref:hypothetical protein n=1 Tax=Rhodococcus qingshengii TaxID=334542 RepID=UPI0029438554|nr:hypothetical protein [Rhodococcus qingshengii]WOI85953.1 hypothetical protein R0122_22500 [Rhodococcus qingshengii]
MTKKVTVEDAFTSPIADVIYFHRRSEIYDAHATVLMFITLLMGMVFFGAFLFFYDQSTIWRWYILAMQIITCVLHLIFSYVTSDCRRKVIQTLEQMGPDDD